MGNLQRDVWEGWTPQDFINALSDEIDMIMTGRSWRKPFKTKKEMVDYIVDHQSFYKKSIPEVHKYFTDKYGLKGEKS
jgi:hypothetical protein